MEGAGGVEGNLSGRADRQGGFADNNIQFALHNLNEPEIMLSLHKQNSFHEANRFTSMLPIPLSKSLPSSPPPLTPITETHAPSYPPRNIRPQKHHPLLQPPNFPNGRVQITRHRRPAQSRRSPKRLFPPACIYCHISPAPAPHPPPPPSFLKPNHPPSTAGYIPRQIQSVGKPSSAAVCVVRRCIQEGRREKGERGIGF